MKKFWIVATIEGVGTRGHVCKGMAMDEAWEGFQRAYPGKTCVRVKAYAFLTKAAA